MSFWVTPGRGEREYGEEKDLAAGEELLRTLLGVKKTTRGIPLGREREIHFLRLGEPGGRVIAQSDLSVLRKTGQENARSVRKRPIEATTDASLGKKRQSELGEVK